MTIRDGRSLSPSAQEELRQRAVRAIQHGMKQIKAAEVFGVRYITVRKWMQKYRAGGVRSLRAKRRGRPPGSQLTAAVVQQVRRMIRDRCPEQMKLPFVLWTREAVQQLLAKRFGLQRSVWTVGRLLWQWGMTPQKPLRRAYEQNPAAVQRWLTEEYPAIRTQAKQEKAEIHWGDEMGVRSDHQTGRSYGLKGRTPVIPGTGQRFRCNMISTITNRGALSFMVFRDRFTSPVFIAFLRRLLQQRRRKIFLIVDRHPVHKSAKVKNWVEVHRTSLRLVYLPEYSPELNPDEFLNNDVKSNAVGRRRPTSLPDMEADLRGYLRSTQKQPTIIRRFFHAPSVRYAAEE
jgi:transposase